MQQQQQQQQSGSSSGGADVLLDRGKGSIKDNTGNCQLVFPSRFGLAICCRSARRLLESIIHIGMENGCLVLAKGIMRSRLSADSLYAN